MPQMHPLLWASLFSFSLICLIFTIAIMFFSLLKTNSQENTSEKPQTKNFNWKW